MVNVKIEGVTKVVNNLARVKPILRQERKKAVTQASVYLMNYVQRNKLSGQVLKRRTGRLAGSIGYKVEEAGNTFSGRVGSPVEYSAIHETGGAGKGVKNKKLSITKPAG